MLALSYFPFSARLPITNHHLLFPPYLPTSATRLTAPLSRATPPDSFPFSPTSLPVGLALPSLRLTQVPNSSAQLHHQTAHHAPWQAFSSSGRSAIHLFTARFCPASPSPAPGLALHRVSQNSLYLSISRPIRSACLRTNPTELHGNTCAPRHVRPAVAQRSRRNESRHGPNSSPS